MEPLPMAPSSCSLDESGLRAQYERYRAAGVGARIVRREPQLLVVALREDVDPELVASAVAVERECCPFFQIDWRPAEREISVSVSRAQDGPALDAIAFALGLGD